MKKFMLFTIAALVCVSAFVLLSDSENVDAVSDASGSCGDDLTYTFEASTGTLTISGTGYMTSYPWSSYKNSIKTVIIGNSVTSIGYYAFKGCTGLTKFEVGENNTDYCSVDGVLFNKNKTKLIQYPASKTDTQYVIPDSVTTIEGDAFYGCTRLTSVTIPDSVKNVSDKLFSDCTSLVRISIDSDNSAHFSYTLISGIIDQAKSNSDVTMSVSLGESIVSFDNVALSTLDYSSSELIFNKLENDQLNSEVRSLVGDSPVYRITFGSNTDFGSGKVTVTVPYVLKDGLDPNNLKVWYINGNDHTEMDCTYENGFVTFDTNHFSDYAVMYIEPEKEGGISIMVIIAIAMIAIIAVAGIVVVKKRKA